MSLTVEQLKDLARTTTALGGPDGAPARAADVLPHLDSDDRNVRVAALRLLAWCEEPEAADGILRGLDDEKKRVREVAAKSSPRFLGDERVVARLLRAVTEEEPDSARPAMEILGGMHTAPYGLLSLEPVADAVAVLAERPKHRQQALLALIRAFRLTPELTDLLRAFVKAGTKEEAVFATRRLDGFRVAHSIELQLEPEKRADAEQAFGQVWYWVRA
jgi:HEAT repeat protein